MLQHKPTEVEGNELASVAKTAMARMVWRSEAQAWRLRVKVVAEERDEIFDLTGYVGQTNYSFALLYQNYVIRKFTKHSPHKIGGRLFSEPHKHVWDGDTENRKAYVPPDINPAEDINDQFLAFCRECHIEIMGDYQWIVFGV